MNGALPRGDLTPAPTDQAKRTRGPNKPKQTAAEPVPSNYPLTTAETIDVQAEAAPFPTNGAPAAKGGSLLDRISNINTFSVLYAHAQDAETEIPRDAPDFAMVFDAIKKRAIHLFGVAADMKGVQEGFELVSALGQPDELKQAANAAYARFRK